MAKRANERDSARKIFDILLNRFGSGVQGHQAMVKFEKRRQRDDKSMEFLWKQRPGVRGMIALPPVASQIPGKYLCFLVTKAIDRQHVDPESLALALTGLRDFLVERGVTSLSLPVYDRNRGKLHPRELYALIHVIFSETDIEVFLHKNYYLSIC